MSSRIYSVSQVNSYIKNMFAQDFMLRGISVSGEVSNLTYHRSGHIYFTLKDQMAAIACVMWASSARLLRFRMKEGDSVVVSGSFDVYERDGRYQLLAKKIELQGAGLLYEMFLRLKNELDEMGMTSPIYKKQIPDYVKKLGIVTAPTGKAIQDIRTVALRRNPYIQLVLYPALVQGEGAAESIARGIRTLDQLGLDCLIVGRGGGSMEDLWAFNEREVAEAIFSCHTPVISAVGHEPDITISDFVADLRAATPSAAAEMAVCDVVSMLSSLERAEHRLQFGMEYQISGKKKKLAHLQETWRHLSPQKQLEERKKKIDLYAQTFRREIQKKLEDTKAACRKERERLERARERVLTMMRHQLQLKISHLDGLSPLAKLNQGYARVEHQKRTIRSIDEVSIGESVNIFVKDGSISANVTGVSRLKRPDKEDENGKAGNKGNKAGRNDAGTGVFQIG